MNERGFSRYLAGCTKKLYNDEMIKAVVTDFSRVLLFPIDDSYIGGLNALNNKLLAENPQYSFWEYFRVNKELLDYYRELNSQVPVFVFTTETIQ